MATPPKVLIRRSLTADHHPDNVLEPGELAVEEAFPTRLWVGVPTSIDPLGRKLVGDVIISDSPPNGVPGELWWETDSGILWIYYDDGNTKQWVQAAGGYAGGSGGGEPIDTSMFVLKAGDVMTGPLILAGDPTANNQAATKHYVDSTEVGGGAGGISIEQGDARWVKKTGDTMTGELLNMVNVKSYHFTARGNDAPGATYPNAQIRFNGETDNIRGLLWFGQGGGGGLEWAAQQYRLLFRTDGVTEFPWWGWKFTNSSMSVYMSSDYTYNVLQFTDAMAFNCERINGHLFLKYYGGNYSVWYNNGNFFQAGSWCAKPGGGPWADNSDARIKTVLGAYDAGLQEILALTPVRYRFKGNDYMPDDKPFLSRDEKDKEHKHPVRSLHHLVTDREFVGLVAQDVEGVMPEMVSRMAGVIDGRRVDDMRSLDTGPLIFALINAVKELKAEIDQLKAERHHGV